METHFATIWLWQCFARDDFQKQHKFESIAEILFNVIDGCASFSQMTVTPSSECLFKKNKKKRVV